MVNDTDPDVMKHIARHSAWWAEFDKELLRRCGAFSFDEVFTKEAYSGTAWQRCDTRAMELYELDPSIPPCVVVDRLTEENLIPGL